MLSFRNFIICLLLLPLVGCGFRPLYTGITKGGVQPMFLEIEIAPIKNREGQILRNELIRHLYGGHAPTPAVYRLVTKLSERKSLLAVKKNAFATRANLEIASDFALYQLFDGEPVFSDTSQITVSYNVLDSEFASHMTEQQARARGLRTLSENMRTQLAAYFSQIHKK